MNLFSKFDLLPILMNLNETVAAESNALFGSYDVLRNVALWNAATGCNGTGCDNKFCLLP